MMTAPIGKEIDQIRERIEQNKTLEPTLEPVESSAEMLARLTREGALRRARELSEIPAGYRDCSLENFKPRPGNRAAFDAAREIVAGATPRLALHGPDPGVGKSHLAVAICHAAVAKGIPAVFITTVDLLVQMRATYGRRRGLSDLDEIDLIRAYGDVPILALDDLGKERLTEWSLPTLWGIINRREAHGRPLIVTSNLSPEQLIAKYSVAIEGVDSSCGATMYDRIKAMTGNKWIEVTGRSMRGVES
jgi:DNA replication protein DnaC